MSTLHTVVVRDHTLVCVQDGDETWVAMRPVVEGMGLAWQVQHRKLTAAADRFCVTLMVTQIPGDDQSREHLCIPLERLFGWLMTIQPSRVRPEIRPTVVAYQQECDRVLARHFAHELRDETGRLNSRLLLLEADFFAYRPRWRPVLEGLRHGERAAQIARRAGYRSAQSVYRAKARLLAAGLL